MEITKQELESLKRLTTDKVAQKILNKTENQSIIVAPEKVISSCCKVLDVDFNEVNVRSRKGHIVFSRQVMMFCLSEFTRLSLSEIAEKFNRDHTTVIHAKKTINNQMGNLRELLEQISNEIKLKVA